MQKIFLGEQRVDEDKYFRNDQFQDDATKSFGITVDKISSGEFGKIKYRGTFYKAKSSFLVDSSSKSPLFEWKADN